MKQILFGAILALGSFVGGISSAATLGLTTEDPSVTASVAFVDYLPFFDGSLVAAPAFIDSTTGVPPVGPAFLNFGVNFDLIDPTTGLSGGFGISDLTGLHLSGDLLAIGFTENVIELQFDNLIGTGSANYGSSVLATISFFDNLGPNPFDALTPFASYLASVTIANVQDPDVIPLPAGVWLMLSGLVGFGWMGRRKRLSA